MYIKSIRVYDVYDEKNKVLGADFFKDLTLLVGKNGSGKTTILNILSNVISGNIFFLKDYKFSKVIINYYDDMEKVLLVEKYNNYREIIFNISFEEENFEINIEPIVYNRMELSDYASDLLSRYPGLKKIKDKFNQFYLPMDRYSDYALGMMRYHNNRYYDRNPYKNYLNDAIHSICRLIQRYIMETNIKINNENSDFRKAIIDILSDLTIDFPKIKDLKIPNKIEECQKDKEEFLKAINNYGIDSSRKKKSYDNFFNVLEKRANEEYNKNENTIINLIWQATQYEKINKVIDASHIYEEKKEIIMANKYSFVNMINYFFKPKKISITSEGEVEVDNMGKAIDLTELSSGEKQLFITIGSLFFGVKEKASSVFIIDEPESSLHIDWQEKFTNSVCSINDNIQIIIATHSPEILGDYTNKIFRLNG